MPFPIDGEGEKLRTNDKKGPGQVGIFITYLGGWTGGLLPPAEGGREDDSVSWFFGFSLVKALRINRTYSLGPSRGIMLGVTGYSSAVGEYQN